MNKESYVRYTAREYRELEESILNKIKYFIKKYKIVYVYGAGGFGKTIWNFLHLNNGLEKFIAGYIVAEKKGNPNEVYGIKVLACEDVDLTAAGVFLALDVKHHVEVKRKLNSLGCKAILALEPFEYYQINWRTHILTDDDISRHRELFADKIDSLGNLSDCQNILLICTDSIGDEVINIPFVRELRKNLSDGARVTMVVQPAVAQIMKKCPYIDKLLVYHGKDYVGFNVEDSIEQSRIYAEKYLQSEVYDMVFLHGWFSVHLEFLFLAVFSSAKLRVGFSEHNMIQKKYYNAGFDKFLSLPIVSTDVMNEVERDLYMLSAVGGKIQSSELEIWTDAGDRVFVENLYKKHMLSKYRVLAIIPAASDEARIWPWERFAELLEGLAQKHQDVFFLLMGGNDAVEVSKKIKESVSFNRILDLSGKTSLCEAAEILRKCFLYVGCNTGLLHIAAAVKTPTVQIMSNSEIGDPLEYAALSRYRTWGNKSYFVRPKTALPGCGAACYMRRAHCIKQITVDEVRLLIDNIVAGNV